MEFEGRTEDAEPYFFLEAEFWKDGLVVTGVITQVYPTEHGRLYAIRLSEPVLVDGQKRLEIAIGSMAGFPMALRAAGLLWLQVGDFIFVTCTGFTEIAGRRRANFCVKGRRPVLAQAAA